MTAPFPPILIAVNEIVAGFFGLPPETDKVGGDLSYDGTSDFYVWLGLVTGSATLLDGSWVVDIDVFGRDYASTVQRALDLEPFLLKRGGHRATGVLVDAVTQNEAPTERFWDDDTVYRIGATYSLTARRGA
jgi:hypothetical protein